MLVVLGVTRDVGEHVTVFRVLRDVRNGGHVVVANKNLQQIMEAKLKQGGEQEYCYTTTKSQTKTTYRQTVLLTFDRASMNFIPWTDTDRMTDGNF